MDPEAQKHPGPDPPTQFNQDFFRLKDKYEMFWFGFAFVLDPDSRYISKVTT
jgi:hypothetical protein